MTDTLTSYWNGLSERDRMMLRVLGVFFLGVLGYLVGFRLLWSWNISLSDELREETERFETYSGRTANEQALMKRLRSYESVRTSLNQNLLPGETPDLAMPELNKIIKDLASKHGVEVSRIQPGTPKDVNEFTVVSVNMPIRCTTTQLKNFLYDLETHQRLLFIPEMNVRISQRRNPTDVKVDLTVSGLIRKPRDPALDKEEKS